MERLSLDVRPKVAVAGPCGAGKSTLVAVLRPQGYAIRSVAQEHSYVPDMWRRVSRTDVLIYLDATIETVNRRRGRTWPQSVLDTLNHRLRHARTHADFYLPTDDLGIEAVARRVSAFLDSIGA